MSKTDVKSLTGAISASLEDYLGATQQIVDKVVDEVAKATQEQLRDTSPKRTGKYAKGWRISKAKQNATVYDTESQLTHLLEFGHAKVNGGRTKAIPHISPAQQFAADMLITRITEELRSSK